MNRRDKVITGFVIVWLAFFHYQTFRPNYLGPFVKRTLNIELPKIPLLFPPAGWIMFSNVDRVYGFAEVYALGERETFLLNPYKIFETRAIGYDNFRRNVLSDVLYQQRAKPFCRYLMRKFPAHDHFAVVYRRYPEFIRQPNRVDREVKYRCRK